jgi:DeoR family transcriptional regulator of aga operon
VTPDPLENGKASQVRIPALSGFDTEATPLPALLRRERVLETVKRQRFASVADLSTIFGVSEVTIRSDLDWLADEGRLQRVRGGAVHGTTARLETPFEESRGAFADEKAAVAAAAATLVESGQTILLDIGTTVAAVARALAARPDLHDVTVFTNGLLVAMELERAIPQFNVLLTGGTLRKMQHSLVDPFGTLILEQIHAHIAFLGCTGIEPDAGVTHVNVAEAEIKRRVMRSARHRVLVADGSKVGKVSLVHVYPADELDLIITDSSADPAVVAALRDRGIEVRVVP